MEDGETRYEKTGIYECYRSYTRMGDIIQIRGYMSEADGFPCDECEVSYDSKLYVPSNNW